MPKRIALFILGLVLAIGAFLAYQYVTNSSMLGSKRLPATSLPHDNDGRLSLEMRHPNGDPEYELRAAKAVAATNPVTHAVLPGQYNLDHPGATYYLSDDRLVVVRADTGTVSIDTVGGSAGFGGKTPKFYPRGGRLHGNVIITLGPKETFADPSLDIKPGQLQIRLDEDMELNHLDRVLSSVGGIHVRSEQVSFDGAGLTIAYNIDDRRIELLRIDKGNRIIIKRVGADMLDLSSPKVAGKQPTTGPTTAAAQQPPAIVSTTGPATTLAATTSTKPATTPTTYRLSFGKDVKATWGTTTLTSDQLFLLFMASSPDAATRIGKAASQPETAPATTTSPATTSGPATTQGTPGPVPPLPKAQAEDLVVEWTGPMEMRPAGKDDLKLVSAKDRALEALGTRERPVIFTDPVNNLAATCGQLAFHAADQRLELEPRDFGAVLLADKGKGTLACQGMTYIAEPGGKGAGKIHFTGPGRAEVDSSTLRLEPAPAAVAAGAPPAKSDPIVTTWSNSFDLDVVSVADAKHPGKNTAGPRRGVLVGDVHITHPTFSLLADALDVYIQPTGDTKNVASFESMLATGNVQVRSARPGAGIDDASKPEGLTARELRLTSAIPPGSKTPVPSKMTATGDVVAWTYNEAKADVAGTPKKLERQQISTPNLEVALAPKDKNQATTQRAEGSLGGVAVRELTATDGVRIDLEGFGQLPITATATKLTADPLTADPRSGKATLEGIVQPNGILKMARLQQGDNQIAGGTLLLDQKTQSLEIPGSGEATFIQPAEKTAGKPDEPGTPVLITWDKKMTYSGKDLDATFGKNVHAKLLGKEDQHSELVCDDGLEVKLTGAAGYRRLAKHPDLAQIIANGNVKAEGSTLDADGKPITRLFLQAPKLIYTHATRTLDIPAAGSMLLEDYRSDDKAKTNGDARGQTAIGWKDHFTYAGATGEITFVKDVNMVHIPLKPFHVVDADAKKAQRVTLSCDSLIAKMQQSKAAGGGNTIVSPVALGAGGNQKLMKASASGGAALTMDDKSLAADLLDFDVVGNKAVASGTEGRTAAISSPQGRVEADEVIWDLTKDQNAFTLIRPRGNVETPK